MNKNIDKLRYIAAFIIVLLHSTPLIEVNDVAHFFLNNMLSRVAVPFFFLTTGFIVGMKVKSQGVKYIDRYIKASLPTYIIWSLIYIIPGVDFLQSIEMNPQLYPAGLLVGIFYLGTYYHLWYFPALFIGLWILKWGIKKGWLKQLFFVATIFLLIGSTETYYGLITHTLLRNVLDAYFKIFITTRNALFFGLFYIVLGYLLNGYEIHNSDTYKLLTFLFSIVFVIEGVFLYRVERLDSNILLSAAPLITSLFLWANNTEYEIWLPNFKYSYRDLSKYYYFIHPLIVWAYIKLLNHFSLSETLLNNGVIKVMIIVAIVHSCANLLVELKISRDK